ncbi:hypothetical protein O181_036765 [Austropuccinia psidii MF-1]|uniref:Uncharacterized protein n=1 Tax=Austropuccinia psidii MF-1 TaxID=1389203 RepID=A0A9Q3HCH0_9BASI|nr:hypothetical protein [Austropuccinia psidii MF-1]
MSSVHLRNLGIPRNQPEDREGFSRTRIPVRGHIGNSGGWKDTEGNNTNYSIHLPIQLKPQTGGEADGSSSSAPPTSQRSFAMEHGQHEVQPSITLGRTWSNFPEDMYQRAYGNHQRKKSHQEVQTPAREGNQDKGELSHYPSYRIIDKPDRAYSDSFRITRSRPTQLSSSFTPFRHQKISAQESPFLTIPGSF